MNDDFRAVDFDPADFQTSRKRSSGYTLDVHLLDECGRTQEMVFDAYDKAFAYYGGVGRRGIYDTMKTAVETIFVGKVVE